MCGLNTNCHQTSTILCAHVYTYTHSLHSYRGTQVDLPCWGKPNVAPGILGITHIDAYVIDIIIL